MVFSSITFLFYFLPIVLFCYYVLFRKYKNTVLLLASLFFYFYGEPKYIFVLLFSCFINYFCGRLIEKIPKYRTLILVIDLVISFGLLLYFKYFGFSGREFKYYFFLRNGYSSYRNADWD